MSAGTGIEWTEQTWNPIAGCTPVSPGCLHCYAATMSHRLAKMGQAKYVGLTFKHNGIRTFNGNISFDEEALLKPLSRKKPTMYFVNSMSDLFHEAVPDDFIDRTFAVMALCPQHTFQVLTKRPERMAAYLGQERDWEGIANHLTDKNIRPLDGALYFEGEFTRPLPNVWLGTSVENQKAADERIPHLRRCPAAVHFLSVEPMLEAIDFDDRPGRKRGKALDNIQWVIVGGESGPGARPCNIEWVRSIVRQCREAGVSCFVKQLGRNAVIPGLMLEDPKGGAMDEWPEDLRVRDFPRKVTVE